MDAPEDLAIGIDLGTTYCCVGVVRNGKVQIIPNEQGSFTTSSYVAFNEVERLIGDAAKSQCTFNAVNTVFDVKRLIGRRFDEAAVQNDMKKWPFKVVRVDSKPTIQVTFKGKVKQFWPEEISAFVLGKMKEVAEAYLNKPVKYAVVTVPAYFNDSQRQSTKDAATICGLTVLRIINEPTAAALAYGFIERKEEKRNVLIFDLGGGTFDVSILEIAGKSVRVLATAGDTHLGGEDFDGRLMDVIINDVQRKHKFDLRTNNKCLSRLRIACEKVKRILSSATQASIDIDSFFNGIDFTTNVTRAKFETINDTLFRMTLKVVANALDSAGMTKTEIDDIVLIGGSTRIPKIQKLLQEHFNGKQLNKTINPDEAVAYGAAVQAAILHGHAQATEVFLRDITPLSLGIGAGWGSEYMDVMIKRNTELPACQTSTRYPLLDNQTDMHFVVYQGESYQAKENFKLGEFVITGIPPAPIGVESVNITFSINLNGILVVTASLNSNRNIVAGITITNSCGHLSTKAIQKMVRDSEIYLQQDKEVRERQSAKQKLEDFCIEIQGKIDQNPEIYKPMTKIVSHKCNEILGLLSNETDLCDRKKYGKMLTEIEALTVASV